MFPNKMEKNDFPTILGKWEHHLGLENDFPPWNGHKLKILEVNSLS